MDQLARIIWDWAKVHAAYVYELEENVALLKEKWEPLENMYKDMKEIIDDAETVGDKRRTNEVNGWLQQVQNLQKVMGNILNSPETLDKCLSGCCPKNLMKSYRLGKKVSEKLKEVDALVTSGKEFDKNAITYKPRIERGNKMPSTETVGLELKFNEVLKSLEGKNVGTIGLYGMGGAGKTTLMKKIHNEFVKKKLDFDVVLWVVVSKDCDINKIMNDIRNQLRATDDIWNETNHHYKVTKIYQVLQQKKFVLMLDDLWRKLELAKVGVPLPKESNHQSKVLFTTRSEDVCAKMQAQEKFKVECLSDEKAFDLFRKQIDEKTWKCHGEIPQLAREMANECKGLPLALITVGSAMAGVPSIEAWRQAKKDLTSFFKAPDLGEESVFRILKFSYDRLPDETHKICFLYCALYPEDYVIRIDRLIDRWIGEGFLGSDHKSNNIYDMYEEGESIIAKLKLSCMLEDVEYDSPWPWLSSIKMHDMIRDMALWLARDEDRNRDKIIVEGEALSMSQMSSERLNVVERISIINHGEGSFKVPACPKLITLRVSGKSKTIDFSHPQSMARLKVLDLSSITTRDVLDHLPVDIGQLINLEFLDLSGRRLRSSFPIEFKNLKNLRVLLMEDVDCHVDPTFLEVIESLEGLKVFRFYSLNMTIDNNREVALLGRLESLPELEELCIRLQTLTGMQKLVNSTKLRDCSRHVLLLKMREPLEMTSLLASLSTMKHLGRLTVDVPNIMEGSSITDTCHLRQLRWVQIQACNSITHLTWLKYAPLIEILLVYRCTLVEEVVKGAEDEAGETNRENANDIFSNLRLLHLVNLPKLKSIHERVLGFPSLKYIDIYDCPDLRKLPLNYNSAKDLIKIITARSWWNNLQWEDATIKDRLQTKLSLRVLKSFMSDLKKGLASYCHYYG